MGINSLQVSIGICPFDEFVEGVEIKSEVEVMDKCFLLVTDVHESGIQSRQEFLHLSQVNVTHRKTVPFDRFLVQFNQPVVFHQSDGDLRRTDFHNKVFYGFFSLFH